MDPQLQEIAKQIADAVEKRLSRRFDGVDKRFDDVDKRFDDFEKRFDDVDKRFDDFEKRFDARFAEAETRLEGVIVSRLAEAESRLAQAAKANMEEVRGLMQLAAEGYGGTLESIDGRLDRLEDKVDKGFALHAKVLREHTVQLKALAPRRSTRTR